MVAAPIIVVAPVIVSASPSGSVSLANTSMSRVLSSSKVAISALAIGLLFGAPVLAGNAISLRFVLSPLPSIPASNTK